MIDTVKILIGSCKLSDLNFDIPHEIRSRTELSEFGQVDSERYRFIFNDVRGSPRIFFNESYEENLVIECALPKLLYNTNIFEINELHKRDIQNILFSIAKSVTNNIYDISKWIILRIDYVTDLKLTNLKPHEIINSLSNYDASRMKVSQHGRNETVTWRSPTYTVRVYDKQKEFRQNGFKEFRNRKETDLAHQYLQFCENVIRHEVQINKIKTIKRFVPDGIFVKAFDKEIQKKVIMNSLGKVGISNECVVNNEKDISEFLYKRFRKDKAENLEEFIAIVRIRGKDFAKKSYTEISFKRYWNLCRNLGLFSIIYSFDYHSNIIKSIDDSSFLFRYLDV